jgi:hypothetical protein
MKTVPRAIMSPDSKFTIITWDRDYFDNQTIKIAAHTTLTVK